MGSRPRLDPWVAVACAVGAVVVFLLFHDLRHDDAFITFRYARNLVQGDGFTFNPGERVLGTSTPLFTLLSAALYMLFGDAGLPTAAVAVSSLALGAQAWLLYLLLRRRLPWTASALAAFTLLGAFSGYRFLALETHLFAALVLLTIWALAVGRPVLCGLALGLAFLTRYDAGLLVPLVFLWQWLREHEVDPWPRLLAAARPLLVAAVPVLPWLVFATLYFGSPLPHTLGAKTSLTPFSSYVADYASRFFSLPGADQTPLGVVIGGSLAVLGLFHVTRRLPALVPLVLYAFGLLLVYGAIGPSKHQHWHLYVAHLTFQSLIVLGALGSVELVPRRWSLERWRRPLFFALGGSWVALLSVGVWIFDQAYPDHLWLGERHRRYVEVAGWVDAHVEGNRKFLAREVGTLGYLTDHHMIDPYGLVTPTNEYPRTHDLQALVDLALLHEADLVLLDSALHGISFEYRSPYATVKVFDWAVLWSTLLVRDADVLAQPEELPRLRRELPLVQRPQPTPPPPPPR